MTLIQTDRLVLRELDTTDAGFILDLLNQPSFLRYIGDKGVRTRADARRYILDGPMESYAQHGFGLFLVELGDSKTPIGICGLLKRDTLPDADLGFALLPDFWSQGYAYESAGAVIEYGRSKFGLKRLLAITNQDNTASIDLLHRLGFQFERMTAMSDGAPEVKVFCIDL